MKRIKIETADKTYYAKPFTLVQLEENEELLNEIQVDSTDVRLNGSQQIPIPLLKKQAKLVLIGLQNHDAKITESDVFGLSAVEISQAMAMILSGSGLEEVKEGNAGPVA